MHSHNTYMEKPKEPARSKAVLGAEGLITLNLLQGVKKFMVKLRDGKISVGGLQNAERDVGFIAQDMNEIVPEAVSSPEDETKEMWGNDYGKLAPVIVSAIQEQQKLIENLQQENSNLKAEVSKVKALEERQVEFEAKILELMETIKRNDER